MRPPAERECGAGTGRAALRQLPDAGSFISAVARAGPSAVGGWGGGPRPLHLLPRGPGPTGFSAVRGAGLGGGGPRSEGESTPRQCSLPRSDQGVKDFQSGQVQTSRCMTEDPIDQNKTLEIREGTRNRERTAELMGQGAFGLRQWETAVITMRGHPLLRSSTGFPNREDLEMRSADCSHPRRDSVWGCMMDATEDKWGPPSWRCRVPQILQRPWST